MCENHNQPQFWDMRVGTKPSETLEKQPALVSSGCYSRSPETVLNNKHFVFTVLKAESPRSKWLGSW